MGEWRNEFQYLLDRKILSRDELAYLFGQIKFIVDRERKEAEAQILGVVEGWIPEENGYSKGLVEDIGSLLMGTTCGQMKEGFKQYQELKAIEKERNVGFNECIKQFKTNLKTKE